MTPTSQATVTRLLGEVQGGDRAALDALFPLVYDALRERAHRQRQRWQGDYTLNTTALVHEAYLKLVDQAHAGWESRAHFLGVASKAIRHILIDHARSRKSERRGGHVQKLSLDEMQAALGGEIAMTEERADGLLALEEALKTLNTVSEREARIVECRFFGGMTVEETAKALGVSPRTVRRDGAVARAWLYRALTEDG